MQEERVVPLLGGLDLVTPNVSKRPGSCIAAQNYESAVQGYRRMDGYERIDGHPQPHLASYWLLDFDSGSTQIMEGDTVTGDTSGATGVALYDATATTGTWGGGDAAGTLILYNVSGTFQDNEGLEVSASNVATADGTTTERGAADDTNDTTYLRAAIEARRTPVSAPTGSGAIRGVCTYGGVVYCFRDNAGGTAGQMYKATASGWSLQSLGRIVDFTGGGTAAIAEGDTITGATSAATATVERVILQSGTWSGGDAAGYLVLSGQSGTLQAENLDTGTQANIATIAGDSSAITLPAGGTYHAIEHNFYGTSALRRLYFVNGQGYAHEWDGSVLAPIKVPGLSSANDTPNFVGEHSNHLLLAYPGGTVLISGTGLPLSYISTDGATEIGLGMDITGLQSRTRKATVIAARNRIGYLTGSDSTDFNFQYITEESGVVANTMQAIGDIKFLDDIGVRGLSAAQEFGDWNMRTDTDLVEPLFREKRAGNATAVGAMRVKSKNQYRLFFDDKTVICTYYGRQRPETMQFLLDFTPSCVFSGELPNGDEILLAGSSDGMVYRMDVGTSADGEEIEAFIMPAFDHMGAPNLAKRFHRCLISVADGGTELNLFHAANYSYGDANLPESVEQAISLPGSGGFWDVFTWDNAHWDRGVQTEAFAEMEGIGFNVSNALAHVSTYEQPHTLTSLSIFWTPRRKRR